MSCSGGRPPVVKEKKMKKPFCWWSRRSTSPFRGRRVGETGNLLIKISAAGNTAGI